MLNDYLAVALGFLIGSIPFGVIVAKLFGVGNLRDVGSGNIGATNVVRAAGWKAGAITFLLDFLKGLLPMLLIQCEGGACGSRNIWIGLAAVIGHCYSPYLKFKGGKGVATTFGLMFALEWRIALAALLIYGVTLAITRVSALGSLFAMLSSLLGILVFRDSIEERAAVMISVFIVIYRHQSNWDEILKKSGAAICILFSLLLASGHAQATITDFRGKTFEDGARARIAALVPSVADAIHSLGETKRLVAVPSYTDIPKDKLNGVVQLGGYTQISAEEVYKLKPDIAIASMDGNSAPLVKKMESLGIPVLTINTQTISDIERSMKMIAAVTGTSDSALLKNFLESLKVTSQPTGKRVFLQVGWNPLVTAGKKTFIHEITELAGAENIFSNTSIKYPRPTTEEVIKRNPDIIFICPMTDQKSEIDAALKYWNRFSSIKAVKNGKVIALPVGALTKPGFGLTDSLKLIRSALL